MTTEQFYDEIVYFPHIYVERNLEEYLRSVYAMLLLNKEAIPDAPFFIRILGGAFDCEPHPFDKDWLKQSDPPEEENSDDPAKQFQYTLDVITFQVAELYKMRGKQLLNKLRYLGLASQTGNHWSNFDPFTNLECGARWMDDTEYPLNNTSWATLGILLERGREYE